MINQNLKDRLYSYMVTKLGMRDYRKNWLKGNCPYCGKRDKFGVNLTLNRSNCFVCGGKVSPFYLVKDLEGLETKREVLQFLNSFDQLEYFERSFESTLDINIDIKLPEGFRLLNLGDDQLAKSVRSYVKKRGFDVEELSLKGWGYTSKGKYFGYLIIPIYHNDKLVYFTGRRVLGSGPKFINLSTDESPLGKNFFIYNYEAIFIYDRIRIVESIMNAETLGDNTIAINGKQLSPFQYSQILKSPVTKIDILLDKDAWINAVYMGLRLSRFKQVRPVSFVDNRDVNDLGKLKTLKRIFKHRYLSYNELLKLKAEYEGSFSTYN